MDPAAAPLFNVDAWQPALETYGSVTNLTVTVYGADGQIAVGPFPSTPLATLFARHGYVPAAIDECVERCLAQTDSRHIVIVAPAYGLAAVGTALRLGNETVGAAVAAFALVDFCRGPAMQSLAHEAGVPFAALWEIARRAQPIPQRRLILHGQLLQVLGDALLREGFRIRQYEETAARLAAEIAVKDEFLAVLSHELRTPLTPILGWARILRTSEDRDQRIRAADSIERNARLQLALVSDLLDLNRASRGKIRLDVGTNDLAAIVRASVDTMAGEAAEKEVALTLSGSDTNCPVDADSGRLQQVVTNILSNAIKFTPPGGRVHLALERVGESVLVKITDTGAGIAPEFLPYAFEMFRQQEQGVRRKHGGLGIGLTLVRKIVELHGGRVEIASAGTDLGTEVSVWLPVSGASSATSPLAPEPRSLADVTILVVDDTEDTLETVRSMLEARGARVVVARDGLEALAAVSASRPALVLCDLRMPRMDGFEFMREVCHTQGDNHVPVVAMSGLVSAADHQRTAAAGFAQHLDKPFDDAALAAAVVAALPHAS